MCPQRLASDTIELPSLVGLLLARSLDVGLARRLPLDLGRLRVLLLLGGPRVSDVIYVVSLFPKLLVDGRYGLEELLVLIDRKRDSLFQAMLVMCGAYMVRLGG